MYICVMETWKNINGFEGLYEISTKGRIKSLGNGKSTNPNQCLEKIIKTGLSRNGYIKCKLHKDGKRYYYNVHRLVALNFIQNIDNKKEVNHKDGNKKNNSVENLEWVTSSENQKHAFKNGLQKRVYGSAHKQSKKIKQLDLDGNIIKIWDSINTLKRELGYNNVGIINCCKKRKKYNTAYKYKWEYV